MPTKSSANQLVSLGRQVSDATLFMHEAIARKAGLTGTDHKYLRIILEKGIVTAGELSALTGLTTGAVTGLIDRLEQKKLVSRLFDKTDRRKILIAPNVKVATKLFANSHLDLQAQVENLVSEFSAKEIQTIEKYLRSSIAIMSDITTRLNGK